MTKDVLKRLENEIMDEIKDDLKLCESEQDPIKKTKLYHKMQITLMRKMIETIASATDKDFIKFIKNWQILLKNNFMK